MTSGPVPSTQDLIHQVAQLQKELAILRQEKADLEIVLETTILHADAIQDPLEVEITERKKTEAALRASAAELQSLLFVSTNMWRGQLILSKLLWRSYSIPSSSTLPEELELCYQMDS